MRAAAAYNKPSNGLEPLPISSPGSFILAVPNPLPLTLTAAKDTQVRGARAHSAWAKAQAPNRNQPAAAGRPGTRVRPRMAPHRPSFLIDNPELEIELSHTKQKLAPISNRQFFAFLELPDASFRVSLRTAKRLSRIRPAPQRSPRTTAKCERLIGNDMHSPTSATALQCATSIFLIGNEFHFAASAFRAQGGRGLSPDKRALTILLPIVYPERFREGRASSARRGSSLQGVGASAPTKERCQFFFLSRVPSARRVRLRARIGFEFRFSNFVFSVFPGE